jgi:hypothetical protein
MPTHDEMILIHIDAALAFMESREELGWYLEKRRKNMKII